MPEPKRKLRSPRSVLDTVRVDRTVKDTTAAGAIGRAQDAALEQSVVGERYGKRTFPTATAVGYATPMYRDAGEIMATSRLRRRQFAEPFFRSPQTGLVERGGPSLWQTVPARRGGELNPPNAFPGSVPREYVSEGPSDQMVGKQTHRLSSDAEAKARHLEAGKRSMTKKGNFLSNLLLKLIK